MDVEVKSKDAEISVKSLNFKDILVQKRDGRVEKFDVNKIHTVLEHACAGITGVSVSDVVMAARLTFYDGMSSSDIHRSLTKAAADLISEDSPNYQTVAGRLLNFDIRKMAWGGMNPPRLYDHITRMVSLGFYSDDLLTHYDEQAWDKMNGIIDHAKDLKMSHIGVAEYMTKYSVRDRSRSDLFPLETPQITYILIAALKCIDTKAIKDIKSYYGDISNHNISLPTPIMAGLRTSVKQYSSCVLIESADSLNSIIDTSGAIIRYVSKKAGIGLCASAIRAEGDKIGNGEVKHTGVIPFFRYYESSVKSCSQGGVRGGSATLYVSLWHPEIENILVLKNNKGTQDTRVRKLDYGIQINDYLYQRLVDEKNITLFSPGDVPDMYEAFFADKAKFAKLYEKYEADPTIKKRTISAQELFSKLMVERKDTGRIYIFNVDNVNDHSSFLEPIRMSNLCAEITLPTSPVGQVSQTKVNVTKDRLFDFMQETYANSSVNKVVPVEDLGDSFEMLVEEDTGRIALCTLSAMNLGNIKSLDDLEGWMYNAVKGLDNLLEYQSYPLPAAHQATLDYRPLGIGVINLAYYLAKNGFKYGDDGANQLIHDTFEAIQFYGIKASIQLAKERGPCRLWKKTKYGQGLLPIDHYNKNVDKLVAPNYKLDWESLRPDLLKYGIRNATITALMPAESSAKISNSTNGVEPIRSLVTVKGNKANISRQVAPAMTKLKNKYDLLWDMRSMAGVIKTMAVIQKFVDQSISTNLSYNPLHWPDGKIPISVMLKDVLLCNKFGIKTLYYHNTNDNRDEDMVDADKVEELAEELVEEVCDSCTI